MKLKGKFIRTNIQPARLLHASERLIIKKHDQKAKVKIGMSR